MANQHAHPVADSALVGTVAFLLLHAATLRSLLRFE